MKLGDTIFNEKFYLPIYHVLGAYGEVRKCLSKQSKTLRAVKIINKLTMAE